MASRSSQKSAAPTNYFSSSHKKSEITELNEDLNNVKPEVKKEALKKVIAHMTIGKDVSQLFQAVIKCTEVNDIEIKKLVYLYIINNSRTRPDDAIMVISLFRKDIQNKQSPLMRALAARTMGCIRVKKLNEYLIEPLKEALLDSDPYVKKTAALCIPKVYEISPELIEENGIIDLLNKMLKDEGNPHVLANLITTLQELSSFKNKNVLNINFSNVNKLVLALNECGEWGQIYVLEGLVSYVPNDPKESEDIIDRILPRLSHINPAVVLTSIKVIIKYMDYMTDDEHVRLLCKKISPSLVTLLSNPPEIQYVALRNIRFIVERQNHILEKDIKVFFVRFNDPYYIKLEKLEIVTRLCDNRNHELVLPELAEYANDVDTEFSRKAIKAIAKICIKLDKAAEKCIAIIKKILAECKKAIHIAHECAIVLQIILRKFPEKFEYDSTMKEFCEFLPEMIEPEAKASLIWIIGEYAEKIDKSEEIIVGVAENMLSEPALVQLQILTATVKLYLKKPDEAEQLIQDVLSLASEQNEIPDVRDRGFIYWRLLSSDPEKTKKIVLSDRPVLADEAVAFEPQILDVLINNISSVSSVLYKAPETIIPRILIDYNKEEKEEENKQAEAKAHEDKKTAEAEKAKKEEDKRREAAEQKEKEKEREKEKQREQEAANAGPKKVGLKNIRKPGTAAESTLEPITAKPKSNVVTDLIDFDDEPAAPSQPQTQIKTQVQASTSSNIPTDLIDFDEPSTTTTTSSAPTGGFMDNDFFPTEKASFVQVPFETVLNPGNAGSKGKKGINLEARFIRENGKIFLELRIRNASDAIIKDFDSQLKPNYFALKIEKFPPTSVNPGQTTEVRLAIITTGGQDNNPPPTPLVLTAGLKSSLDVFYFNTPCMLHTILSEEAALGPKEFKKLWKDIPDANEVSHELASFNPKYKNTDKLKELLKANNINLLTSRANESQQTVMYFTAKSITSVDFLMELCLPSSKSPNGCSLSIKTTQKPLASLFIQCVSFVLTSAQ